MAVFIAHKRSPLPTHKEGKERKQIKLSYSETMGRSLVPSFSFSLLRVVFAVLAGAIVHLFVKH